MEAAIVVIKVKYGDTLRRFNASVVDEKLNFNMSELTEKIFFLFSFASNVKIMLTYTDEDGDLVALVDDSDLHDIVKQGLNPLRINVELNTEKIGTTSQSAGTSPSRSPHVQLPFQNSNAIASELLKTIPTSLRETLVNLPADLVSKLSSPASGVSPDVSELINYFSKVGLSYLNQLSETQTSLGPNTQSGVPESIISAPETENPDLPKVYLPPSKVPSNEKSEKKLSKNYLINEKLKKPVAVKKNIEVKCGETIEPSSSKVSPTPSAGEKEMAYMTNECDLSVKSGPAFSYLPPVTIGASNPVKRCSLDGRSRNVYPNIPDNTEDPFLIPSPVNFGNVPRSSYRPPYECPFSELQEENVSASGSPQPAAQVSSFSRSKSQNDGSGIVFHRGVRCDGCGVYPITGPRFKCKVKVDYDLCNVCFEEMGNDDDYIRMDRPAVNPHQWPIKQFHDHHNRRRCPAFQQVQRGSKAKPGSFKLDSRFIQDVNVLDGTVIAPLTPFTKIWRMRNNGTVVWPQKTQIVWIGGDKLSNTISVEVEVPAAGLAVDTELDVAVDFIAPELPGRYISYWRMASSSGQNFGQRVWVLIHVDPSLKETQCAGVEGLNLNLPLVDSVLSYPDIFNMDLAPLVEDSFPESDNSKKILEMVDPEAQQKLQQPNIEQELKFPITDSLLVGSNSTSSVPLTRSFYHPYPIVDLSKISPPASLPSPSLSALNPPPPPSFVNPPPPALYPPSPPPPPPASLPVLNPPPPVVNLQACMKNLSGKEEVEKILLRELEEMGFKQVELNKEILRMNEYDLEQAVDDLCGVAEWDPLLNELQEMGFHDTETNKALLKKNNGSIKQVVIDLIYGEKS